MSRASLRCKCSLHSGSLCTSVICPPWLAVEPKGHSGQTSDDFESEPAWERFLLQAKFTFPLDRKVLLCGHKKLAKTLTPFAVSHVIFGSCQRGAQLWLNRTTEARIWSWKTSTPESTFFPLVGHYAMCLVAYLSGSSLYTHELGCPLEDEISELRQHLPQLPLQAQAGELSFLDVCFT